MPAFPFKLCRFWRQWYLWYELHISLDLQYLSYQITGIKQHFSEHLWSSKAFSLIFLTLEQEQNSQDTKGSQKAKLFLKEVSKMFLCDILLHTTWFKVQFRGPNVELKNEEKV